LYTIFEIVCLRSVEYNNTISYASVTNTCVRIGGREILKRPCVQVSGITVCVNRPNNLG